MFSDQKHLDFSKNQAALLLERINKKLNNSFSNITVKGDTLIVYLRKQDIHRLQGFLIPEKIGHLTVEGRIIKERNLNACKL